MAIDETPKRMAARNRWIFPCGRYVNLVFAWEQTKPCNNQGRKEGQVIFKMYFITLTLDTHLHKTCSYSEKGVMERRPRWT